jgi:hypothetical protein
MAVVVSAVPSNRAQRGARRSCCCGPYTSSQVRVHPVPQALAKSKERRHWACAAQHTLILSILGPRLLCSTSRSPADLVNDATRRLGCCAGTRNRNSLGIQGPQPLGSGS